MICSLLFSSQMQSDSFLWQAAIVPAATNTAASAATATSIVAVLWFFVMYFILVTLCIGITLFVYSKTIS